MLRVAICDDNMKTIGEMKEIVQKCMTQYTMEFQLILFDNGNKLLEEHENNPINIIFLDIDMPNITGFDVARSLRNQFSGCYIIFVTSYAELVYESMDFQPFNFIRKNCPIPLAISVDNVLKKLMYHMKQAQKIVLDDCFEQLVVFIHDIIYLESSQHYIFFYITNKNNPIKVRGKLSEYEEQFKKFDFVRIHRKYLINLKYLSFIDGNNNEVFLRSINRRLIMSRYCKKEVEQQHINYLRSIS